MSALKQSIMKDVILLSKKERYFVRADRDFSTKDGIIRAKEFRRKKFGDKIKTHLGKEFLIAKPTMLDVIDKKVRRSAQVILPKDIGIILAYTGLQNDSIVVDIGTGSGYLSIFMANFAPNGKVTTYERDRRFFTIAKENIKYSGLKNLRIKHRDATRGIDEKNVDLVTVDIKNPEKILNKAYKALVTGGHLVVYSPTADELMSVVKAVKKLKFPEIRIVENIVREWQAERTLRPKTMGLMHTGFITFVRKLS